MKRDETVKDKEQIEIKEFINSFTNENEFERISDAQFKVIKLIDA